MVDFLRTIDDEVAATSSAAARAGLSAAVPSCPGWTVADLLYHAGEVLYFWAWVVESGATDVDAYDEPARPGDDKLEAWFAAQGHAVSAALRSHPADQPAWSWAPGGGTVGWIVRRMAHEAAVHRWDADAAAGDPAPLAADLAADGVDEFLTEFTGAPVEGAAAVGGTVHLHCTDVEGEWLVDEDIPGGPLVIRREHAKGDAAVRGTASDLDLLLWRRVPLDDRFDVFGDRGVVERLLARSGLS
jgi:uncharacterized protein (TIGR03083 family)